MISVFNRKCQDFFFKVEHRTLKRHKSIGFFVVYIDTAVGKQTHDLTVIARDSKTTQSGGDNRKKFPLGAALQVPQFFSFAPL